MKFLIVYLDPKEVDNCDLLPVVLILLLKEEKKKKKDNYEFGNESTDIENN